MPEDGATAALTGFGLAEIVGTRRDDVFDGRRDTVLFGGPGNDSFRTDPAVSSEVGAQWFVGGSGGDRYVVSTGTFAIVADASAARGDTLVATDVNLATARIFEIDRAHLAVFDDATQTGFMIVDWLVTDGRIDTFELAGGTQRFGVELSPIEIRFSDNFLGSFSFEEVASQSLLPPALALDDDALEAALARAAAAERQAGDGLTIVGGDAAEVFEGTSGPDDIRGAGGDDTIAGGASDLLRGGGDADTLDGGAGADALSGGAGDDRLQGGPGPDQLAGGAGPKTFRGAGPAATSWRAAPATISSMAGQARTAGAAAAGSTASSSACSTASPTASPTTTSRRRSSTSRRWWTCAPRARWRASSGSRTGSRTRSPASTSIAAARARRSSRRCGSRARSSTASARRSWASRRASSLPASPPTRDPG